MAVGRGNRHLWPCRADLSPRGTVDVQAKAEDGTVISFTAAVRVDTPEELTAYRHGGILPYVARRLAGA